MGDYSRRLDRYTDVSNGTLGTSFQTQILATDTATVTAIAAATGYTTFVQKIQVAVTTDAAQSLTFQDNAGTPIVLAKTKASPGLGPINFDFGPDGYPLTESKQLDIVISGAGLAASVSITAYRRATATTPS